MSQRVEAPQPKIDLQTAIRAYNDYLETHPYSFVFVPLAHLYRMQGRFDEAIRVCQGGLRMFPGYLTARTALGLACRDKGDYARARTELERVVSAMSENVLARRTLAEMYRREGEIEKALAHWRAIAALFPDHADTVARVHTLEEEFAAEVQRSPLEEMPDGEAEAREAAPSAITEVESPLKAGEEAETEGLVAAVEDEEGSAALAQVEGPCAEAEEDVDVEQVGLAGEEGVLKPAVSLPTAPGILPEVPEGVGELEEFSEEAGQEGSVTAEAASEFELSPPPMEEELAPFVEELPPDEGPSEDPRQQALLLGGEMAGPGSVPTQTRAELYEAQGYLEEAIEMYQALLEAEPSRVNLREKLEEVVRKRDLAAAEDLTDRERGERISLKSSPFFMQERSSEEETLLVGGSFVRDIYEQKRAERRRREETRKAIAELEQWLRRLRDHEG